MYIIYRLLQPCFSCTDWLVLHLQFWKLSTVQLLGSLYVSTDEKYCVVPSDRKLFLSSLASADKKWEKEVCKMKKLNSYFVCVCNMSIYCRMMLICYRMSISSFMSLADLWKWGKVVLSQGKPAFIHHLSSNVWIESWKIQMAFLPQRWMLSSIKLTHSSSWLTSLPTSSFLY